MKDEDKIKEQLLKELAKLHQQIAELKRLETEHKRAEQALRESEEMYKTLLETSFDSIAIHKLNAKVLKASEETAELLGYESAEELIGRSGFEFVTSKDQQKAKIAFQRLIEDGFFKNLEFNMLKKDGTCWIAEANAALIKNAYDKPRALIATVRDITERKRAEEILRNSEQKLQHEVKTLRKKIKQSQRYPEIIGNSPGIIHVIDLVNQVARTNSTVLIYGETGSGKDIIAKAIHFNSPRKEGHFMVLNCAALPEHLIESELFGYVKGAFTGAIKDKKGLFEEANEGTIFLNEITEMPMKVQAKLLHVIENQQIRRLGQSRNLKVDVRIIAASNKDLEEEVNKGRFRGDLFYRLNVFPILVPTLRERKEDIPLLAKHFLDKHCPLMKKQIKNISQEAMDMLCSYHYPGNVRELENIIQRSIIIAQGSTLLQHYLPKKLKEIKYSSEPETIPDMEKQMIESALKQCQGHFSRAAQKLGIHRTTLWRKIKKLDIKLPPFDA